MQVNRPTGRVSVTSFRLLPRAPVSLRTFSGLAGTRCFGTSILRLPLMNWLGQGFRDRHNGLQRPFRYYLAAVNASAGTDIDHMVGGANGVFVVLNDDHRVA